LYRYTHVRPMLFYIHIIPILQRSQLLPYTTLFRSEGAADQDLLSGSTFTITNMGAPGVEYFTPILNSPESGILGVGGLQEELTLNDDQKVEMEKVIPFSLTVDHHILDGADSAELVLFLGK